MCHSTVLTTTSIGRLTLSSDAYCDRLGSGLDLWGSECICFVAHNFACCAVRGSFRSMPPVKEYKIESISEAAPTVLDIKQTAELKKVRARLVYGSQLHSSAQRFCCFCSFLKTRVYMRV